MTFQYCINVHIHCISNPVTCIVRDFINIDFIYLGCPYNQLAALSEAQDKWFEAVFYYMRRYTLTHTLCMYSTGLAYWVDMTFILLN